MWNAKATSKTQRLILIYTPEVSIYFISWTKFLLNNHQSSKALKVSRQLSKLDKNNRQPSKLPPHWDPHSYCLLISDLKKIVLSLYRLLCPQHIISGIVWSKKINTAGIVSSPCIQHCAQYVEN